MKQQIDSLIANDEKLQNFIDWTSQKAKSVKAPYSQASIRAYYFALAEKDFYANTEKSMSLAYKLGLDNQPFPKLDLDWEVARLLDICSERPRDPTLRMQRRRFLYKSNNLISCLTKLTELSSISEFKNYLHQLKEKLPHDESEKGAFENWWIANGESWLERFRTEAIKYCEIGYNWNLNEAQNKLLKMYYEINELLVDCLCICVLDNEIKEEIKSTILFPVAEIEKRKREK